MQQSFAKLFQSSHLGVVIATPDRVVDANDAFLQMAGYSREELMEGQIDWRRITPPEFRPSDQKAIEQLQKFGVAVPYEKAFIRRDGSRVDFVVGAVRLSDDPITWACYTVDLTETKQLREAKHELLARQKIINQLAHELNNPLAALTFLLHLAMTHQDLPSKHLELLQEAIFQLSRISDTVREVVAQTEKVPVAPCEELAVSHK